MKNSLLAEEISFYGAAEGAYFYDDAAGTSANGGAATAQNPYAVLALFDASFATFGADYAEALAAINAAIADLSGAIAKLDAAKGDENELKKAQKAVTAGALERAKSTAEFAQNVAERESKIAATTEKIASAMGVSAGKDASAEQLAAALTAAVKTTVGISDADIANMSADLAQSGAANGVLRAKLEAQMKDAGKFKELSDDVSAAAKQEQTDAAGAVSKKAAAQLAKKAADAVRELEAAKKAAGKGAEADKKVALLEKLAKAAEANADASNSAHAAALQAEQDAAAKKLEDIAAAAEKADALAKKVLANKSDADALQQAINDAKNEAKKTADAAQKAEAAASAGYAAKVKIAGEEVKIAFENLDAYADFAHDKANAAAIEAALAAVKLSELAGKKITSVGGWKFSGADASAHTIDAQFAGAGVKFTFADAKSIGDLLATTAKFDGGISAAELISDGGVSAIDGLKIAKNATAQSNIDLTVAEGVVVQFAPDASAGGKFSAEMLGKLAALKTTASVDAVLELGAAAVGGKAFSKVDDFVLVTAADSKTYYMAKSVAIDKAAALAKAESEGVADAATAAAAKELKSGTIADAAETALSQTATIKAIANGELVKVIASPDTLKGYLTKAGDVLSWLPAGGVKIDGVKMAATQDNLFDADKDASITTVKALLADNTKIVAGGVTITVGAANASTVEVGGKTLTLADEAKIADVVGLKADSSVKALNDAGVKNIGANVHVESGTVICVKKDADWGSTPTTDDIKLTVANTVKLSAIKDLSKASTAAELVKAGVTKVGANDSTLSEIAGKIVITKGDKKYVVDGKDLQKLFDIDAGTQGATEGLADLSDKSATYTAGTDAAKQIGDYLKGANALEIGQKLTITSQGTISKTAADAYSWESNAGGVVISKLAADVTIGDLVKVAAATASIAQAQAVAANGAKITVSGHEVPAKLFGVAFDSGATLANYSTFAGAATVANFKALVGSGTSIAVKDANGDAAGTFNATSSAWTGANSINVSALENTAKIADVIALSGETTADVFGTFVGDNATITAGGATYTHTSANGWEGKDQVKISALANSVKISDLSKIAKGTALSELKDLADARATIKMGALEITKTAAGKLTVAADQATMEITDESQTLDAFNTAFGTGKKIIGTLETISDANATVDLSSFSATGDLAIKVDASNAADYKITTPKLADQKVLSLQITGNEFAANGNDKITITGTAAAGGQIDKSAAVKVSFGGITSQEIVVTTTNGKPSTVTVETANTSDYDLVAAKAIAKVLDNDGTNATKNGVYLLEGTSDKYLIYVGDNSVANDWKVIELKGLSNSNEIAIESEKVVINGATAG